MAQRCHTDGRLTLRVARNKKTKGKEKKIITGVTLCLHRSPHTLCATIAATCASQEEPFLLYFHPCCVTLVKSHSAKEIVLLLGQHRTTFGNYLLFDASICVLTSTNPHDHCHCQIGQICSHSFIIDPDWSYKPAVLQGGT